LGVSVSRRRGSLPLADPSEVWRYDRVVSADPLKSALEEIAATLDDDLQPLIAALLKDEPLEEAWEAAIQGILDAT
jgi:hypothetical protein